MTDASGTGPPEKRERRPGQEAATLGKAGKVNSRHNATNSVALSPKIDAMALNQWRCENGLKLYPVLLPHGTQSVDGSKWCVGTVEIDLKGQTPGRCRDTSTGARGTGLFDIAEMTGLPWPQTIVRTRKIMAAALAAAAPAKIDAQSPKPNGHDLNHQPNTSPPTRYTRTVPPTATGAHRANGIAAAPQPGHSGDENRPFWTGGGQQPSNTAEPEIIPPALTAAKAAAAALTRDSDSIAIRQVIEKIALARSGALFEEQLLLLVQNQAGTGKKALNTELRDAKKRQAAARPPQQLQSYNGASDWRENLIENEWGEPKPLMTNVCLALGDQVWDGVLGFNEFTAMIAMRRAAPWIVKVAAFEERPWTDADTRMATMWVQGVAHIHASSLVVFEGIQTVAEQHPYHPVRNYLDALTHDGSPRIDDLLIRYYGAGGDPPDEADGAEAMERWREQYAYYQAVGARFLIGAVARIYQPGCKNDCMPNFVGAQGALKSSSLAALFDPWFTDEIADLGSKDAAMQSAGVWCVEISELAAISRVAIERVKAWLSRQKDRFRPPYGRLIKEQPRQSVAAGTTNVDNFLVDDTGNRRMWSVRCGTIDIDALRADRDQLWAEARDRYRRGEKWWLHEPSLIGAAAEVQAEFTDDDIWTESVMGYIAKCKSIGIPQLLRDCIGIHVQDQTQPHGRRVASILRRAGWTRKQIRNGGKQVWRYFPHDVTTGRETGDGTGDS